MDDTVSDMRILTEQEFEQMRTPREFRREFLNEWVMDRNEDEIVFVYATKHFIAKKIYTDYFLGKTHRTTKNFRFLHNFDQLHGLRGKVKIVISSERFLTRVSELLEFCEYYGSRWGRLEVIYEQDLEAKQIGKEVPR